VNEIDLNDPKAEVISRQQAASGDWCHGVRFCLEDVKKDEVFRALLQIEDRLKSFFTYG